MAKYSYRDIKKLATAIKREPRSFDFLTGAGMSVSAGIPLASELVREISDKYPYEVEDLTEEQRKDYGSCMDTLPLKERKKILQPYLEEAKADWAHIALASLIDAQHILARAPQ